MVLFSVLVLSASPVPGFAQTALTPSISGNELTARIEFGAVAADLTVTFENVVGLNPGALALSATLVNPGDALLLSRLPSGVSIPSGLPIVVRIDPTASSALAFEGVYKLSLYTHNLTLGANSPLRLYRAPTGGGFQDMTGSLQAGSVRAGGSGPGFSEFLIAADTRLVDSVIVGKFDTLQGQLSANSSAIAPAVAADLQQRLNQARAAYNTGNRCGRRVRRRGQETERRSAAERLAGQRRTGKRGRASPLVGGHVEVQPRLQVEPDAAALDLVSQHVVHG
jgi:hypothetical protein